MVNEEDEFLFDWDNLIKYNDKLACWICIPDTEINNPVAQGEDNTFYMTHTFAKKENSLGSIFLDANAKSDFTDNNTFIYGRDNNQKTMFAELKNFADPAFFQQHPYVYLLTPKQNYRCEIICSYSALDSSDTFHFKTSDNGSYEQYIELITTLAKNKRDVEITSTDKIITLSTCLNEYEDKDVAVRYVLHAKLVPMEEKQAS